MKNLQKNIGKILLPVSVVVLAFAISLVTPLVSIGNTLKNRAYALDDKTLADTLSTELKPTVTGLPFGTAKLGDYVATFSDATHTNPLTVKIGNTVVVDGVRLFKDNKIYTSDTYKQYGSYE
ncbi:MAG: hypothetical protein LBQ05_00880, partial [Christensenellaceae bacterium]|nr:hypothetical protein [Christensenellaceae bacterium]